MSTSGWLERIGQVAFIVMCITVSGAAGFHLVSARRVPDRPPAPAPVETGRQLTLPPEATEGGTAASLLLMLSTTCRFCTDSMPFYTRLAALPSVREGHVRLSTLVAGSGTVTMPGTSVRVGPGYLTDAGARLVEGRDLALADEHRAVEPVDLMKAQVHSIATGEPYRPPARVPAVVVDAAFARGGWSGSPAVGQTFVLASTGVTYEVVGVVESLRHSSRGTGAATMFELHTRRDDEGVSGLAPAEFMVRTAGPASDALPAVLATIRQVFPDPARLAVRTVNDIVADESAAEAMGAAVFGWFGVTSAAMGLTGIYGLVAYLVARQRRELGIRAALGASSRALRRMVVMRVMKPVCIGAAGGVLLAVALVKLLSALVPGIGTLRPSAHVLAATAFVLAAWLASRSGASGAAGVQRINPADLLRTE